MSGIEVIEQLIAKPLPKVVLRGVGYGLIGSTLTSIGEWQYKWENIVFGSDGMVFYEAMIALFVGSVLVFVAEFISNYCFDLKEKVDDRAESQKKMESITGGIEKIAESINDIKVELQSNTKKNKIIGND